MRQSLEETLRVAFQVSIAVGSTCFLEFAVKLKVAFISYLVVPVVNVVSNLIKLLLTQATWSNRRSSVSLVTLFSFRCAIHSCGISRFFVLIALLFG